MRESSGEDAIQTQATLQDCTRGILRNAKRSLRHQRDRFRWLAQWIQGHELWIRPQTRCRTVRLGSGDGEWTICPDGLDESSVVYSFGVGFDVSFDLGIIRHFGARVHAFDPTPLSLEWVQGQRFPEKFKFHPYGLAVHDGSAAFFLPIRHSVSFTMSGDVKSKAIAECKVRRFKTILQELGHERIDVVKIDIEGAEYDVIPDILEENQRINQLLVEFHHRMVQNENGLAKTQRVLKLISEAGFTLFHVSPRGLEYSFLRLPKKS